MTFTLESAARYGIENYDETLNGRFGYKRNADDYDSATIELNSLEELMELQQLVKYKLVLNGNRILIKDYYTE